MLFVPYKIIEGVNQISQYLHYNTPVQFNCSRSLWWVFVCAVETNCQQYQTGTSVQSVSVGTWCYSYGAL